jgi:hypothetical protein
MRRIRMMTLYRNGGAGSLDVSAAFLDLDEYERLDVIGEALSSLLDLFEATKAEVQAHVRGLVEAREEAKAALDRIVAKPKNDDETDP